MTRTGAGHKDGRPKSTPLSAGLRASADMRPTGPATAHIPTPPAGGPASDSERRIVGAFQRAMADGSTSDAIHAALAEGIENGDLQPGTRLDEASLAGLFSVSRTPIREALMRLEAQHLAERDGRSLVVGEISVEQIIELYAVREALDGAAARLAATNAQPIDLVELESINQRLRQLGEAGRADDMVQLNVHFHTVLARASRNEMLQRFVGQVHSVVRRFGTTTFSRPGRAVEAVAEHVALLEALREHNADLAERLARQHMRKALDVRIALEIDARTSARSRSG
jgi:DNA-binding GntR family transcriptional regulator